MSFRYIFTGTVSPERAHFSLPNPVKVEVHHIDAEVEGSLSITIYANQITMIFDLTKVASNFHTLKNIAVDNASVIVDAFALEAFMAFDIDMRQVYSVNDGETYTFGINFPGLSPIEGTSVEIGQHFSAVVESTYYMRALGDFRRAMSIPHDTGFLCYRAFEALVNDYRSRFVISDKKKAIEKLCNDLNIDQDCASFLRNLNKEVRHGHPVFISGDDRRRALIVAQATIKRFGRFITAGGGKVEFERLTLPVGHTGS